MLRSRIKTSLVLSLVASISLSTAVPAFTSTGGAIERISGMDRYETAIEISKKKSKTDSVVIASGENYSDALSGGNLAAILDGTVLLTKKSEIGKNIIEEIN